MSSEEPLLNIVLHIDNDEGDGDELDQQTRNLLDELREQEIESAELIRAGTAPDGTKSVEVITLGSIAIAVLPKLLPRLVDFLQAWVLRAEGRKIKIKAKVEKREYEIEYSATAMSDEQLKSLLAALNSSPSP